MSMHALCLSHFCSHAHVMCMLALHVHAVIGARMRDSCQFMLSVYLISVLMRAFTTHYGLSFFVYVSVSGFKFLR